jgi:hypothetical protein
VRAVTVGDAAVVWIQDLPRRAQKAELVKRIGAIGEGHAACCVCGRTRPLTACATCGRRSPLSSMVGEGRDRGPEVLARPHLHRRLSAQPRGTSPCMCARAWCVRAGRICFLCFVASLFFFLMGFAFFGLSKFNPTKVQVRTPHARLPCLALPVPTMAEAEAAPASDVGSRVGFYGAGRGVLVGGEGWGWGWGWGWGTGDWVGRSWEKLMVRKPAQGVCVGSQACVCVCLRACPSVRVLARARVRWCASLARPLRVSVPPDSALLALASGVLLSSHTHTHIHVLANTPSHPAPRHFPGWTHWNLDRGSGHPTRRQRGKGMRVPGRSPHRQPPWWP